MTALAPLRPRLAQLVRLFASDKDGEALAAARAIGRTLHAAGLDLHDFAASIEADPSPSDRPPPGCSWHEMVDNLWLHVNQLSPRDAIFIADMAEDLGPRLDANGRSGDLAARYPPQGGREGGGMSAAATYQARPIKRRRRTGEQVGQLDWQILEVLASDYPQSVRHVFYRMTDPRLPEPVEKSDRGYAQVQDRVVKLRRSGALPYGYITDASRRGYFTPTYGGTGDFLRRVKGLYRADLSQHASHHVEVWTESRSIAGVIQADCEELAVSLYPCGGFSSISLAFEAAEAINSRRDGKPVSILYIGDYDPAGVLIDVALERELRAHLRPDVTMEFSRLGITPWHIQHYDLPGKPRKVADRRALHIRETVEAEALPARILRAELRAAVEYFLPANAIAVARAAEESEAFLIDRLARLAEASA